MKARYAAAGIALVATAGCIPTSAAPASDPAAPLAPLAPSAPPATVYVTEPPAAGAAAPTLGGYVTVPAMADRRLDVAEYMLRRVGLVQQVVGSPEAADDPSDWYVCASQPRANTRVSTGTQVALIVENFGC
ncbi:MAG TPA: PASTA domain-containing protein [Mycobacteriales bacterium]|nr:PASTA domain-containing protein [Mycobacteriales bacterium]